MRLLPSAIPDISRGGYLLSKHVVILGCGRSGTSIFGELFETLPGYTYLSEPHFGELLKNSFQAPNAVKVPRESEDHIAPVGLSFPIEQLLEAMPEPPVFFWQVRHPLDAIASLRVGISHNWGHHPRPPDWEEWLSRPLLEQCAHHWLTINREGYGVVKDYCSVSRFEDMLSDPEHHALLACGVAGIDTNLAKPQIMKWADRVQDTDNEKFVEAVTSRGYSRPDHRVRVGRWRENLMEAEVETIWPMVAEVASGFGYTLD